MDHNILRKEALLKASGARSPQLVGLNERINNEYMKHRSSQSSGEKKSKNFIEHINHLSHTGRTSSSSAISSSSNQDHNMEHESSTITPTSLTNLAQLSGITLLPVSRQRHISSNAAKNQHVFRTQASQIKPSNKTSKPIVMNIAQMPAQQYHHNVDRNSYFDIGNKNIVLDATNTNLRATTTNPRQQPIYNLASIDSIDSINQTSLAANNGLARNNTGVAHNNRTFNSSQPNNRQYRDLNDNNRSQKSTKQHPQRFGPGHDSDQVPLILNSNVQLIPMPNSYDCANYMSSSNSNRYDDQADIYPEEPATLHSNTTRMSESMDDIEMSLTNDSILQLMAVFSNPAITITPVSATDTSAISNYEDNIGFTGSDTGAVVLPIDNIEPLSQSNEVNHWLYNTQSNDISSHGRIPKSAENLQMIYGESLNREADDIAQKIRSEVELTKGQNRSGDLDCSSRGNCHLTTDNDYHYDEDESFSNYNNDDASFGKFDAISNSIKNLLMNQQKADTSELPTVSVQLLKQIAKQSNVGRDECCPEPQNDAKIYKSGVSTDQWCSLHKFDAAAKFTKTNEIVYIDEPKSLHPAMGSPKIKLKTTKDRLYLAETPSAGKTRAPHHNRLHKYQKIIIETLDDEQMFFLSDRHEMVESMRPRKKQKTGANSCVQNFSCEDLPESQIEPKSRIETTIERRKLLESGIESKDSDEAEALDLDFDFPGNLDFYNHDDALKLMSRIAPVSIQLPSEGEVTDDKSAFMRDLGLVTRYERNKVSLDQQERKLIHHTALAYECAHQAPEELKRFVSMIEKTGGTEIQLRTETDIKRNDLPLLEGLNRYTSRLKMSYMSILGLDKRSKRTALYKVGKSTETPPGQTSKSTNQLGSQQLKPQKQANAQTEPNPQAKTSPQLQHPNDLRNRSKDVTLNLEKIAKPVEQPIRRETEKDIIPLLFGFEHISRPPLSSIAVSCRDAMNKPSKQDYMRSLGLISS